MTGYRKKRTSMDYTAAIENVYEHIENEHVDKAVMGCLRIARHLKDYLYAAIFLREMYPNKREVIHALYEDTSHLNEEAQKFLWEKSLEYWLDLHTLNFSFGTTDEGEDRNVLAIGVGTLDREIEQLERSIQEMIIPPGLNAYDSAALTDRYNNEKSQIRLRIMAIQTIKERVRTRCLNYAIRIERQLEAQRKAQNFLEQTQSDVNNYFKAHSEDVYIKIQKAAQLLDSDDPEDLSLLLTQVRRAIKAAADFFYPPSDQKVKCADGTDRVLGDEQYLNRLHEFMITRLAKSSSRDLLGAELEHLAVFVRRLTDISSKGVHANVSLSEAKQGLLGLYLFLYNLCSHLDENRPDQSL